MNHHNMPTSVQLLAFFGGLAPNLETLDLTLRLVGAVGSLCVGIAALATAVVNARRQPK